MYYSFNPGIIYHYSLDFAKPEPSKNKFDENIPSRSKLENYLSKEGNDAQTILTTKNFRKTSNEQTIYTSTRTSFSSKPFIESRKSEAKVVVSNKLSIKSNTSYNSLNTANKSKAIEQRFEVLNSRIYF